MTITKDQILSALPYLDEPALQAIVSAAKGLLAGRATPLASISNDPQAWLYEALTATLAVTYPPSWHTTPTGKLFARNAPTLLKFYTDAFGSEMHKRIAALGIMRFGFDLLAQHLFRKSIPLSTGVMVRNMDGIPALLKMAFPNYIESGMGNVIVQHIMEREPYGR